MCSNGFGVVQETLNILLYRDGEFEKFKILINSCSDVEAFLRYNWLKKILETFRDAKMIDDSVLIRYNGINYGYYKKGFMGILAHEIKQIKNPQNKSIKSVDHAYAAAFQTLKDVVEHKIPKIISLFESIIVYVGERNGMDMSTFSLSRVKRYYETGVRSALGEALIEYGFPLGAVRRLEDKFNFSTMNTTTAKVYCRLHPKEIDQHLDAYERKLFRKAIRTIT